MNRGGNAYAAVGSKLNKLSQQNGQQIKFSNNNDQSLSNGYLVSNGSHASPKFNNKSKYFSNQPLMNMKFPTTSHGNRSSTNHGSNYTNMQNVLGNI